MSERRGKKRRALACLIVLSLAAPARADESWEEISLREVVDSASQAPPQVLAALASLARRQAEKQVAAAAFAPVVGVQGTLGMNYQSSPAVLPPLFVEFFELLNLEAASSRNTFDSWTRGGTISADLPLFSPGRLQSLKAAKHGVTAARRGLNDVRRLAVAAAVEVYVRALATRALVADAELTLERRSKQADAVADLVRAGLRPSVEATRTGVEATSARHLLEIRRIERAAAFSALAAVIGRDPERGLAPRPLGEGMFRTPRSVHDATALAIAARPDLRRLESQVAARQDELRAASLQPLPTLGLSGTASMSYTDQLGRPSDYTIVGTSKSMAGLAYLRWNLDAKVMLNAKVARAALVEAQRALERALLDVRAEAVDALYAVQRAHQALQSASERLAGAEATREAQVGRYQIGVASLIDLLDAEALEQDARRQRVEAARDYDIARIRLLSVCGTLQKLTE